eukprot:6474614-Amphidinium_carterae.1
MEAKSSVAIFLHVGYHHGVRHWRGASCAPGDTNGQNKERSTCSVSGLTALVGGSKQLDLEVNQ